MSKKKILIVIVALAALLRFYFLGKNPPSLNLDEVAIGYNAYTILKTGRDEYGERFPLAFRSHDDYKPPLYIYLTVPSIAVFGLNEFAVRFPSALAGTLTVLLTYFLAQELFNHQSSVISHQTSVISHQSSNIAIIAAFLLAISPWHLQYSRAGYEVNIAVFLLSLGTWALLKGFKNGRFWYLSAIAYALTLYAYQAARLFLPLFALMLFIIYGRKLVSQVKNLILPLCLFIVLSLPVVILMTTEAGTFRFKGTSIFEHPGIIEEEIERSAFDRETGRGILGRLFHNRRLAALETILEGYLKHFRPDFLFLGRNGPPVNFTPNAGLLYIIELPFILFGIAEIFRRSAKQESFFLLSWMFLAPVAASLTWDIPSATRMTIALPTFQILSAAGLYALREKLSKRSGKKLLVSSIVVALWIASIAYYLHQYYIHAPFEYAESWQYGYKEAAEFAWERQEEYDRIIVSTNLKQPQNFFAFYGRYDPWTYIFVDGGTVSGGFLEERNRFANFEFHKIDYNLPSGSEKILMIDLYDRTPGDMREKLLKVIQLPNGKPFIAISVI